MADITPRFNESFEAVERAMRYVLDTNLYIEAGRDRDWAEELAGGRVPLVAFRRPDSVADPANTVVLHGV